MTGIEDLRDKREEINRQILKEDEEKAKVRRALGGALVWVSVSACRDAC